MNKLYKLPIVFTAFGVLLAGFSCATVFDHTAMPDMLSDSVVVVSWNGEYACCYLGISGYLELWKNVLLVGPRDLRDELLLLIAGLAAPLAFGLFQFRNSFNNPPFLSYKLYTRDNPELALFNQLKLAFARGILNPKIYKSAIL